MAKRVVSDQLGTEEIIHKSYQRGLHCGDGGLHVSREAEGKPEDRRTDMWAIWAVVLGGAHGQSSALSDKFPMLILAERFAGILGLCQD